MIQLAGIPLFGHRDIDQLINDLKRNDRIQMALAHLVLHNPLYLEAYSYMTRIEDNYTILDNSLIEMDGKAMSIQDVAQAANMLSADELILPDVFKDPGRTIIEVNKAIATLNSSGILAKPTRYMAVCHGTTWYDFRSCFMTLMKNDEISCIGIPKVASIMDGADGETREYVLRQLFDSGLLLEAQIIYGKDIHLLGAWTPKDMMVHADFHHFIRSIDTVLPSWEASHGKTLSYTIKHRNNKRTPGKVIHADQVVPYEFQHTLDANYHDVKEWLK